MGLLDGLLGNASKIDPATIRGEMERVLAAGETVDHAYLLIRDFFVFTNQRLVWWTNRASAARRSNTCRSPIAA